jgi:hypothetical protein
MVILSTKFSLVIGDSVVAWPEVISGQGGRDVVGKVLHNRVLDGLGSAFGQFSLTFAGK